MNYEAYRDQLITQDPRWATHLLRPDPNNPANIEQSVFLAWLHRRLSALVYILPKDSFYCRTGPVERDILSLIVDVSRREINLSGDIPNLSFDR